MANTKGGNTSSQLDGKSSDSEKKYNSSETDDDDLASLLSEEEPGETVEMASLANKESNAPKFNGSYSTPTSIQGTINLLSVDVTRVAEFAARQYVFIGIFVTILIAIVVLVRLIGFVPLLAGLIAPVILTPVNMLASKAYAIAQKKLMKERDEKVSCVTEALQGIRQIKFSAAESEWEKRIMAVRDLELGQQRRVFIWTIMLRFFWISSPILLSLISLATYSWTHKSLSPSVAFTALGVFGNLEFALSLIPFGVTQGVDASVSSKRIEDFIYGPKKKQNTLPGESVQFQNTTIAWPLTEQRKSAPNAFKVKNANAKFPAGKLR
jgi:ABC-type multidrug transport system fused ATPase/permease subunit